MICITPSFARPLAAATIAVTTMCTAAAAPVVSQVGNLLGNGNFEAGSVSTVNTGVGVVANSALSGWLQYANSSGTTSKWAGTPLIEGNHLAEVSGGVNDGLFQYQFLATGSYTISAWVKVLSGSVKLGMAWNGGSSTAFALPLLAMDDWQYVTLSTTINSSTGGALLYGGSAHTDFLVDGVWMNAGTTSTSRFAPSTGFNPNPAVPEPGTAALLGAALLAAAVQRRRAG